MTSDFLIREEKEASLFITVLKKQYLLQAFQTEKCTFAIAFTVGRKRNLIVKKQRADCHRKSETLQSNVNCTTTAKRTTNKFFQRSMSWSRKQNLAEQLQLIKKNRTILNSAIIQGFNTDLAELCT